ncbi:MAG: thioesterase family protein [Ectothiorhodospiraceae bacterium]|nr:thioesterase family protein [Ectothiorhodospiraceae bacterium]
MERLLVSHTLVGLSHSTTITVDRTVIVSAVFPGDSVFSGLPPVFATAFMVGLMERTCAEALIPHLAPGQATVGTDVNVSHCSATPVGVQVTAYAELADVDGRVLTFRVRADDAAGLIGQGTHQRMLIDKKRFLARALDRVHS